MTKDKKIEIQNNIIHRLEEEKKSLLEQNKNLKKMVDDNKRINEEAIKCIEHYNKALSSINELKKAYLQAIEDISIYKKEYSKQMDTLLKTVKKNI